MSKISELTDGGSLLPTDFLIAVRSGGNVKVKADQADFDRIRLGDNEKIELGNNQDLQIYHTGTNSILKSSTGEFLLQGDGITLRGNSPTETMLTGDVNGAITLHYDSLARLATTATGVDITGGFTATAASTITTADNSTQLTLISTDADSAVGPVLDLFRNSATPGNFDLLGKVLFSGEDDGGNKTEYAHLQAYPQTITGGAESGYFEIHTLVGGTDRSRIEATATEVSINPTGIDSNFRVRSGNNTNALFLEGGNSFVGLSTNAPLEKLQIDDGNIVIYNTGVSSSANATIGHISGRGRVGSTDPLARMSFGTDAIYYHGVIDFQLAADYSVGALETRLKLYTDEAVFNEAGSNVDFRVESDSNANMLFVDAGANDVIIGAAGNNASSSNVLVVAGDTSLGNRQNNNASYITTELSGLSITDGSNWYGSYGSLRFHANQSWTASARQFLMTNGYKGNQFALLRGTGTADSIPSISGTNGAEVNAAPIMSVLEGGHVVFNDNGFVQDFRVETDFNANAIFVDASSDIVSIGTAGGYKAAFESNSDGVRIVSNNIDHTLGLVSGNSFASGANYTWCKATGGTSGVFDISVNTFGVRLGRNSTSWASLSDSRLKTVTGRYTDAITDVKELDPVKFTWNNDPENSPNVGFLAQSVQGVVPEAVTSDQKIDGDDTKYLSVKYTEVIPLLTAALQEAITKIETLEARITALES